MIHYDLIIPSASRPHLLQRVLRSFFQHADQWPIRLILHDDAAFPGRQREIVQVVDAETPPTVAKVLGGDNPPIYHGPTLKWLFDRVQTEYVLYTQDDHEIVRDLPIRKALHLLDGHGLNQIRFNKRDTLDKKGREGEEFHKVEYHFGQGPDPLSDLAPFEQTLCAADHWYFQCGVWRVAAIQPVINWWSRPDAPGAFTEHCEYKINDVFNGKYGEFLPAIVPCCLPSQWNVPAVRATVHKTFIWGKVGEPRFVEHIGHLPEDWALKRDNRDPQQRQV